MKGICELCDSPDVDLVDWKDRDKELKICHICDQTDVGAIQIHEYKLYSQDLIRITKVIAQVGNMIINNQNK